MPKIPPGIPPPPPPTTPWKKEEVKPPEIKPARPPEVKPGAVEEALARMDAAAIAARLALLGAEAKRRELSMTEIVERAMLETGIINPQAAMEEANRKLHKEIENMLEIIKADKELMEEAEAWQALGELLESRLTQEQIRALLNVIAEKFLG